MNITHAMQDAAFVQLDGTMFVAEYVRIPDESTMADDIVVEASAGDEDIELTLDDVSDAAYVGEGLYQLKSGSLIRFLTSPTMH